MVHTSWYKILCGNIILPIGLNLMIRCFWNITNWKKILKELLINRLCEILEIPVPVIAIDDICIRMVIEKA